MLTLTTTRTESFAHACKAISNCILNMHVNKFHVAKLLWDCIYNSSLLHHFYTNYVVAELVHPVPQAHENHSCIVSWYPHAHLCILNYMLWFVGAQRTSFEEIMWRCRNLKRLNDGQPNDLTATNQHTCDIRFRDSSTGVETRKIKHEDPSNIYTKTRIANLSLWIERLKEWGRYAHVAEEVRAAVAPLERLGYDFVVVCVVCSAVAAAIYPRAVQVLLE